MAEAHRRSLRVALIVLAIVIGAAVSIGERLIFAAALSRDIDLSEIGVVTTNAVLTAFPFLYLALRSSTRLLPWLLGLTLTLAANGWWLAKGIAYQRAPDGSGVDMFGALLMLLSPFIVTAIVAVLDRPAARR
ncbi:hypothetical protein [Sphingomonas lacusdianchii]|uniref:hypothetical protein n=1 Tax=Sphingomonas lacusdianchii TaxID=2917992 RepID=UPI001F5A94C7|nr:hypothetical protein [Sphingomonas sp. JXJ CY 53]